MISYERITNAESDVVGALQREGGELSYPELVSATRLPNEIVSEIVDRLRDENRVEVAEIGAESSKIRLVRLRSRPFMKRFASFLSAHP